mmetsp:Transcript_39772/g.104879  ORF Transcript_39772/g.104879 Transcript_39772/m.104879 type:complete len:302 (+) Transcript_39772:344-1249(+)
MDMPAKFDHSHAPGARSHLILGVPKKGRLYEKVAALLQGAGIEYARKERIDIAECSNLPMSIVFLPAKDIPTYVGEGDVDLGITGEDVVAESDAEVHVLMQLGFGKCSLSVQAPVEAGLSAQQLAGKRIVTSFPNITRKFFAEFEEPGLPTQIKNISGSVEAACGLGLADGIVDLVETGTTMRAAGLEEVHVVMKSQCVLVKNPHTKHPELVEIIRRRIAGYLTSQSWVMVTYNVHRSDLKRAEAITPGKRSPSIQPLEDKDWVAVQALVPKAKAPSIMDELEEAGAKDILLTGLLSTRMG